MKVSELAVGGTFGLALTSGHRILAWGDNQSGQLGTGSTAPVSLTPVPVQVRPGFVVTGIGAGVRRGRSARDRPPATGLTNVPDRPRPVRRDRLISFVSIILPP